MNTNYKTDPLFKNRMEEKLCIIDSSIEKVLRSSDVVEDKEAAAYIRSVYFDTTEHAMPLGYATRLRDYGKNRVGFFKKDEDVHIFDTGYASLNSKHKDRGEATVEEVVSRLNSEHTLRVTNFRPYIYTEYYRRVFKHGGMRVSIDTDIALSWIKEDLSNEKVESMPDPNTAQVEIKYINDDAHRAMELRNLLKREGAVPSVGKKGMAYNARWVKDKPTVVVGLESELPGKEYEIKYDSVDEKPFMGIIIALDEGNIEGFRRWPTYPNPFRFDSINEYRVLSAEKTARVMYFGKLEPRVIVKNKGTFTDGGILLRTEEKYNAGSQVFEEAMKRETFGTSRRIKEVLFVESMETNRLYPITVDLNQVEGNAKLYQIEIEYYRSTKKRKDNACSEILGEIGKMSGDVERLFGLKRSEIRKEDWIASTL